MREMGQDGTEGEDYIGTSDSWAVNAYLRTDGDMAAARSAVGGPISKHKIKTIIDRLDSQMRPLTRNIKAVRFVDEKFLDALYLPPVVSPSTAADLQRRIGTKGINLTPKNFTSFSTDANANVFTWRPIKINFNINKGTKCIMTSNEDESEGILARGVRWKITGARWARGSMELDVTV